MAIKKYEGTIIIEIDEDKCDGSGDCAEVCPVDLFDIVDGKSQANRVGDCIECCACVDVCPTKAIKHTTC